MKKLLLATGLTFALAPNLVMAEETQIDPADVTQTNTFLWGQAGNKDYTLTGGIAGNLTEKFNYLGLLEHSRSYQQAEDHEDTANSTRARLFGTQDVEWNVISKVGVSVDYIKNHTGDFDLVAIGAIAKVETGLDWLAIFPNLAHVTLSKDNASETGYQANLIASVYLDDAGKYLMIQPQYTNVNDKMTIKKFELSYGQPLSNNGLWWGDIKVAHTSTHVMGQKSDDNQIKAGVSYYF
ncbi:hypothetical protein [Vibrio tapetis]|uniref:Porin n=1 Tax=Vibrio tapetis subsp. tapetis TaxID=1671868 RepID=A0A2N8ZKF3_9VIBR|nr:hypothetical protein [Vibrio tapetis]SON52390.1 conserved exported protein of unknown function [Vibrio tapetis subsp. tapetis]